MTTQTEALMLAREYVLTHSIDAGKVFIAIEEALAQPEHNCTRSHPHDEMSKECELRTEIARLTNELARLKAQPKEPEQEPVAEVVIGKYPWDYGLSVVYLEKCLLAGTKLYTTPPQRTWVGLTDEEVKKLRYRADEEDSGYTRLIKATEAKLKEKNNA